MVTSMLSVGCVGMLSNGPSRDVDAIRKLGFQMLLGGARGTTVLSDADAKIVKKYMPYNR